MVGEASIDKEPEGDGFFDARRTDGRPLPANRQRRPVPLDRFRRWLESRGDVGRLEDLLVPVVVKARRPSTEVAMLASAVLEACHGAYIFHYADEATIVRSAEARLKGKRPRLQRAFKFIKQVLLDHAEQSSGLTAAVERQLQRRLDSSVRFPDRSGLFLPRFFDILSEQIEVAFDAADPTLAYFDAATRHGCLDMGRKVLGYQVRSTRSMLAFNLVFLFRSASLGSNEREGHMPRGGRPHTPLVATLVNSVMPDGEFDVPVSPQWVASTEKSILKDNPHVRVVSWPTGMR